MMEWIYTYIGKDADTIVWWQMVIRGTLLFFYTLLLVRIGGQRIFGKHTSFDIVLGVILGSIMSRALTANAQIFPTMAAGAALVGLHIFLAKLACYSRSIGYLVKGREIQLVEDGKMRKRDMTRAQMTEGDLAEALRTEASTTRLDDIKEAYLERSGDVSMIPR